MTITATLHQEVFTMHRYLRATLFLSLLLTCFFLLTPRPALACVGRTLYVGTLNNPDDRLMADMLALLINERTGTTVKIRRFDTAEQLYAALAAEKEEERVDIIVEDTGDANTMLGRTPSGDPEADYLAVKKRYDEERDIIWLNPFGFTATSQQKGVVTAPLVRRGVLTNFPLLPRVLNKLAGAIDDTAYAELLTRVQQGEKPRNVAKDFLRQRKLI